MIVARDGDRLRLVTQSDHAHLAGSILTMWRTDGLPEHPRRQALLFAAREHDNGWREADAAPQVDPESGKPYDFTTLPDARRREIWRRGTERHAEQHPYAALLILEHARKLHRGERDEPAWQPLLADWETLRDELLERTGADPATVAADYRWLDLTDLIALSTAAGWSRRFSRHGVRLRGRRERPGARSGERIVEVIELDPFPLAGATTFGLPCRYVPARSYAGDSDLALEAATAHWREARVRLVPASM